MTLNHQTCLSSSVDYVNANTVLTEIRKHWDIMSKQEYRTLKGQALSGDICGAERGLKKSIRRHYDARNR